MHHGLNPVSSLAARPISTEGIMVVRPVKRQETFDSSKWITIYNTGDLGIAFSTGKVPLRGIRLPVLFFSSPQIFQV